MTEQTKGKAIIFAMIDETKTVEKIIKLKGETERIAICILQYFSRQFNRLAIGHYLHKILYLSLQMITKIRLLKLKMDKKEQL